VVSEFHSCVGGLGMRVREDGLNLSLSRGEAAELIPY
jgi:hypothetical protein